MLLTEHHLEFLSLKGGCRGSSESTLVKMSNCWKSHAAAPILLINYTAWSSVSIEGQPILMRSAVLSTGQISMTQTHLPVKMLFIDLFSQYSAVPI